MNILLIAPHPFYQDRGTPIAVDMLLRVLSSEGHRVDVCAFPEGDARTYPGVAIHRAKPWGKFVNVAPGFSIKKLYTDLFLLLLANRLCRQGSYDVIHAIEEAGFFGLLLKARYGIPFVYDMDSVLSEQLTDSRPWMAPLRRVFEGLENWVVSRACVIAPMCQALADRVQAGGKSQVVVLKDVSLIEENTSADVDHEDLRQEFDISGPMVMYVGNLESYQGIDLLLNAMSRALSSVEATLVIVGGKPSHIRKYREQARILGIEDHVRLTGPRPVERLGGYLRQADILVSPRTKGNNTPMKIYSYLHSGVVLLATDLPTHTQVVDNDMAHLSAPDPESFGRSLVELIQNEVMREAKGRRAAEYAQEEHSFERYKQSVRKLYGTVADTCQNDKH